MKCYYHQNANDLRLLCLLITMMGSFLAGSGTASAQKFVGGDISVLQSYEDNNVAYYDEQGTRIDDVLKFLKSGAVGWNALRLRLFVDPQRKNPEGKTDAQVCQDLDYVVRLAKRIKAEGFTLLLDFHYSDTWADPSNQWTPAKWASMNDEQLQQQIYDYTKTCLEALVEADATPDYIQTGNEISYGMLWGTYGGSNLKKCFTNSPTDNWTRFIALLQQAVKACRDVCPEAKVMIHTERAGNATALKFIYDKLATVDYDVIGLSYYPFWHGSLATLSQSLNMLATQYPTKKVQIVETAYYYQYQPAASSDFTDYSSTWPVSAAGQAAYIRDLAAQLKQHDNVDGLYWWFPEENGNGPNSKVLTDWVNRGLWNNSTHRAMQGVYELKNFLDGDTGVEAITANDKTDDKWYTLSGQQLTSTPSKSGIYINANRKINHIKN